MVNIYETPSEKFKRIAENRTNNAINEIRKLGNCSKNYYKYTKDDIDKIFSAIEKELELAKQKFYPHKDGGRFTLK